MAGLPEMGDISRYGDTTGPGPLKIHRTQLRSREFQPCYEESNWPTIRSPAHKPQVFPSVHALLEHSLLFRKTSVLHITKAAYLQLMTYHDMPLSSFVILLILCSL